MQQGSFLFQIYITVIIIYTVKRKNSRAVLKKLYRNPQKFGSLLHFLPFCVIVKSGSKYRRCVLDRFIRSWRVFRKAESLLCGRGVLAAFPAVSFLLMSAVVMILAAASFFLLDLSVSRGKIVNANGEPADPAMIVCLLFICLTVTLTANFCSAAFYSEIFLCLKGEKEASLCRGFRFAAKRFLPLFLWSLLSATVGVLLRMLSGKNGRSWISKPLWLAWSVASCFAIPVIVCDPSLVNPFRALKRSGSIICRTWGEALIGFAGLKILLWAGMAAWFLLVGALWTGARAFPSGMAFFIASAVGGTLLFGIFAYLVSAAETVYRATLFLYAEEGFFPDEFESDDLNGAFLRE